MPSSTYSAGFFSPSFADAHSGRIVVLADDLTGACDSAAAFLRSGRTVRVWFGTTVQFSAPETVQAFNTDSRSLPSHRAARAVSRAVEDLGSDPNSLFFKKVDSAARGPFAAEILAAHRALGTRAILLAPAFPSAGRTVRDGVLHIEDAASFPADIFLADLFPASARDQIACVANPSELAPAIDSGKTILLCNSTTQADLEAIARAAQELPGLLYAGSAGLAQALASLSKLNLPYAFIPPVSCALLIAGSPHPMTKLQLETLDRDRFPGLRVLNLPSAFRAGARIRSAFRSSSPEALILTGGETALRAAEALEAHSFILQGEIAPGIPWGLVQGGVAHGCVVITKSGGFGAPTVFNEILSAFRGPA
ncbi:putative Type III effector Hrp-dependent outers [Candidatus Sulfotelmatomonas gaucii]|uniref:Putative Type III effector Hrp-dependent outers n=1 Tax=Candidatus Sulfuritelmatomonas gaucii TaxID=2043161 RepID=A0A2N9L815_9BACT|nr:putative Type III effector Hrp-dependent outers [Candidatus Sulfotelmatomonas gaucii]